MTAAGPWLVALAGLMLSYVLRACRVRAEWRDRRELGLARCIQIVLLHNAALNVLPMRAGEFGYPWLLLRHAQVPVGDSAASLLWMRLQDGAVLGVLAVFSALGLMWFNGGLEASTSLALLVAFVLALLVAAWLLRRAYAWLAAWSTRGASSRPIRWLQRAAAAASAGFARADASTWGWCAANWVVKLGALGALLSSLCSLPAAAAWCAVLAGELAAALPVQPPAGFGTYEAAVLLGATLAAPGSDAVRSVLVAAVTVHLFVIFASLAAGGLAWLAMPRSRAQPQAGDAS